VFEWFVEHTRDAEGVQWLLVRWFGYGPDDDKWQHSERLLVGVVHRYRRR